MFKISPTYEKIANNNLKLLQTKCNRGIFQESLFKTILNGPKQYYSLEKIGWMKDFLEDENQQLAAYCLSCLIHAGANLNDFVEIIKKRIKDTYFSLRVIELAEKINNPDVLLLFLEEKDNYINRVILALKKNHNESYLATLLLSENQQLVKTIDKLTKEIK